jgi:hypothetical protein
MALAAVLAALLASDCCLSSANLFSSASILRAAAALCCSRYTSKSASESAFGLIVSNLSIVFDFIDDADAGLDCDCVLSPEMIVSGEILSLRVRALVADARPDSSCMRATLFDSVLA